MIPAPLDDLALVGDGRTAALVRRDGAVVWWCPGRFDAPSVFAALLDEDAGGRAQVRPLAPHEATLGYLPDTTVAETRFVVPGEGVARVLDVLADGALCRRIEGVEGRVQLRVHTDARPDYGRGRGGLESSLADGTITVEAGERRWWILGEPPADPDAALETRCADDRAWLAALTLPTLARDEVARSALTLRLLQHQPTGAFVAAPTTSVPEWLGGQRNWDYRFAWIRDASMTARTLLLLGADAEAERYLRWVQKAVIGPLKVMYTLDGGEVPAEETLPHLAGHGGSAPVRIGHGARHPLQLDSAGARLDLVALFAERGNDWDFLRPTLGKVIAEVVAGWPAPDHGIWEPRSGKLHNVHSKVMCWVALDRAAQLGFETRSEADAVRADVLKNGLDNSASWFRRAYEDPSADGALLTLPLVGFLPPHDPRVVATIDRVQQALGHGHYLYRYAIDDGVGGAEGAFVLCGYWLAQALHLIQRRDDAHAVFEAHRALAGPTGLLAEEVDPHDRRQLGNFPQAFSHLGLIETALMLDGG